MSDLQSFLNLVSSNNFVVLDTETTGLDDQAQVIQVAAIAPDGAVLIDSLVKPTIPVPADAIRVHGITNEMLASAVTWPALWDLSLRAILENKRNIIYNADYDVRLIRQTCRANKVECPPVDAVCAMLAYAEFWGDWDDYYQSYTWQRLTAASLQQNLAISNAHTALGDCQMTLALIKHMASKNGHALTEAV